MVKQRAGYVDVGQQQVEFGAIDEPEFTTSEDDNIEGATPSEVDQEMRGRQVHPKRAKSDPLPPRDVAAGLNEESTADPEVKSVTGTSSDGTQVIGVRVPIIEDRVPEPRPKPFNILNVPDDVYRDKRGKVVDDRAVEALLGADLYKKVKEKAENTNASSVAAHLAMQVYYCLETGVFSGCDAKEEWTIEDANDNSHNNICIAQVVGQTIYDRIKREAQGLHKSILSVFRSGCERLVAQNRL